MQAGISATVRLALASSRAIFISVDRTAINDGSNCPALYIMTETDKGDGSAPSVGIKGSPAKDWLDMENAEALNEPPLATAPQLNDAQQKIGTDALLAINDLLKAMAPDQTTHKPDLEKYQAAADKLHQLFGGKESPEFYKPISEYVNYMLTNGPQRNRSDLVRVGTSEITGQTFLGLSNTVSNKYAPFIQIGGVADCSRFKG